MLENPIQKKNKPWITILRALFISILLIDARKWFYVV